MTSRPEQLTEHLKEDAELRTRFFADPIGVIEEEGYVLDPRAREELRRLLPGAACVSRSEPTAASLGVISGTPPATNRCGTVSSLK